MRRFGCAALAAGAVTGFASLASAADMPVKAPVPAAPYNWTGFSVAVQGGWGKAAVDWQNTSINTLHASSRLSGGFFGVRGGYDYQWNNLVLGASVEYNWSKIDGRILPISPGFTDYADFTIKNFGSIDGRIGWALDRIFLYTIGGYAWSALDHNYTSPGIGAVTFPNASMSGWDLGGGVAFAFTQNMIGSVEYRHYNFGTASFAPLGIAAATHDVSVTSDTVRGVLAYKF